MGDLISRSAVLEILSNEFDMAAEERAEADNEKDRTFNAGEIHCARRSTRKVNELPAVDAVPVVHARWIAEYRTICSACKTQFDDDMFWIQGDFIKPNYCPNCGAKMDAEE